MDGDEHHLCGLRTLQDRKDAEPEYASTKVLAAEAQVMTALALALGIEQAGLLLKLRHCLTGVAPFGRHPERGERHPRVLRGKAAGELHRSAAGAGRHSRRCLHLHSCRGRPCDSAWRECCAGKLSMRRSVSGGRPAGGRGGSG